jgi:glycosyltransferase involved in cell wall biosynthesis
MKTPASKNPARPRVLLLVEQANPAWQSVPLVGWSHYEALAKQTEAHLVTHIRNREDILNTGLEEGSKFTAIDSEAIAKPIWKLGTLLQGGAGKGWTTLQAVSVISYYYFEYLAWKQFKSRLIAKEFDLVHRITPVSPTMPSPMAKWCHSIGVPFVLGPLNGGLPWPKEFPSLATQEREWLVPFRDLYRKLPYQQSMQNLSSAVIVGSRDQWHDWRKRARNPNLFYIPENGIDPRRFANPVRKIATKPIKILFAGRMVPYKAGDILIDAIQQPLRAGDVTLTMLGDGPHRPLLEKLVDDLSLRHAVTFVDPVPHTEIASYFQASDLFGFPSLREFGGAVVVEAMAQGSVPIVVDYGGPPEFLNEKTGTKIPLGDRDSIAASLAAAVQRFIADPTLLEPMSQAARADVKARFTWDAKAKLVLAIYDWLLERGDKPSFAPPT